MQIQPSGGFHVAISGQDISSVAVDCSFEPSHAFCACVVDKFRRALDQSLSGLPSSVSSNFGTGDTRRELREFSAKNQRLYATAKRPIYSTYLPKQGVSCYCKEINPSKSTHTALPPLVENIYLFSGISLFMNAFIINA